MAMSRKGMVKVDGVGESCVGCSGTAQGSETMTSLNKSNKQKGWPSMSEPFKAPKDTSAPPFKSIMGPQKKPPAGLVMPPDFLPRHSPFVGFISHAAHAPALAGQLDRLQTLLEDDPAESAEGKLSPELPRKSPYIGYQRHAPPSPALAFGNIMMSPTMGGKSPLEPMPLMPSPLLSYKDWKSSLGSPIMAGILPPFCSLDDMTSEEDDEDQFQGLHEVPEDAFVIILSYIAEVAAVPVLANVARRFKVSMESSRAWEGVTVRIYPSKLHELAPRAGKWLPIWRKAEKLVVPRSHQLLKTLAKYLPEMKLEIAWRFYNILKGDGVKLSNNSRTVERVAEENLVILGDAPLPASPDRGPYLEVSLDNRGEDIGDGLNDFGIGVTAADPHALTEIGEVAAEMPRSWVVDFTKVSVMLNVNNTGAVTSDKVTADMLVQGDRVGLRASPADGAIEVFINGELLERLLPTAVADRVPPGIDLYPVMDLYGKSVQMTRTEGPGGAYYPTQPPATVFAPSVSADEPSVSAPSAAPTPDWLAPVLTMEQRMQPNWGAASASNMDL